MADHCIISKEGNYSIKEQALKSKLYGPGTSPLKKTEARRPTYQPKPGFYKEEARVTSP